MHRPRLAAPLAILAAATLGLAACTGSSPQPPAVDSDPDPQHQQYTPQFHPEGTAEQNLPWFTETLDQFVEAGGVVQGQPVVDAVVAGGFDKAAMQVSFDRTKTDLVSDAIFVSVRIGTDCLIGQVMTGDRSVTTIVEPAVGPEHDICLIGNTRPIDW